MNLFKSKMIAQIEQDYLDKMKISSLELMDRAAETYVNWLLMKIERSSEFLIVCGPGNNGADGLLIGSKLESRGYNSTIVLVGDPGKRTKEFNVHLQKIQHNPNFKLITWSSLNPKIEVSQQSIIIDAILGIGINRPVEDPLKTLIGSLNVLNIPIYSVDVPSGLDCDSATQWSCIRAVATLTFEWPKISFFHKENEQFLGDWAYKSIGLSSPSFMENGSDIQLITGRIIKDLIPERLRNTHKGSYGHIGLVVGSYGMAGAAVLCAKAALQMGIGLCTVISEDCNRAIIQANIPEVIFKDIQLFKVDDHMTYAIGPGLGQSNKSLNGLLTLLDLIKKPILFDADALNLLSENKTLLSKVPAGSILTPHPKEFARLFGKTTDSFDRLQLQTQMSSKYEVIIVLKDHHTTITTPQGQVYYNNTGNPGMATGGSGDVLTGMIASLMAQGISTIDAALIGVYIHGLAADIAIENIHMMSLTPSDIIVHISKALQSITRKRLL